MTRTRPAHTPDLDDLRLATDQLRAAGLDDAADGLLLQVPIEPVRRDHRRQVEREILDHAFGASTRPPYRPLRDACRDRLAGRDRLLNHLSISPWGDNRHGSLSVPMSIGERHSHMRPIGPPPFLPGDLSLTLDRCHDDLAAEIGRDPYL